MCGIAGLVDMGGLDRASVEPRLAAALDRMRRRGPDGEGQWTDSHCALGHRRLAIVDLSPGGAQPMARGDQVIVFNGMIYNFRALRDELGRKGHRFQTDTDTEVLLAGWREWGEAMLPRLVGMFALAIWDSGDRELVLARDRFGKKPLLYRQHNGYLTFASDLVALQRLDGARGTIDPAALRLYFALRYLPEPWSILEGVVRLPPGHLARFDKTGLTVRRWYALADHRPDRYDDKARAATDLRERVDAAVEDRLVADVPIGAYLSGGIDSAIIAASMVRAADTVRTFTVGFEGAADYYEERPQAKRVADHLGTEHTEITVTAEETRSILDQVFDALDEPFADSSAIPSFLIARETRKHVTVALSGDGADEVFGGYRKYQGELHAARFQSLPAWFRDGVVGPALAVLPESKSGTLTEGVRRARRFADHAGKDAVGRQAGWARQIGEEDLVRLFAEPTPAPRVEDLVAELRAEARESDPINAMLAADIGLVLAGDMLVKVDRTSMAHGLEVRCPFLDHRVVECAAAMPGALKLSRGVGKRILRRAFAERLPAEVFSRPKRGFEVPIADWLMGPLKDLARQAVDPARLKRHGLFRPELPSAWLHDLVSGRRDKSWELWTLIAYHAWEQRQAGDILTA
ncbi:MAG: asparagine synthase (glutamine-hydrolyzing) [Alphaproteobacteria bacterium]|nr:asparagine synthase (glutamine-hydrolyzing) [Alphaproteobacteria bacterium]